MFAICFKMRQARGRTNGRKGWTGASRRPRGSVPQGDTGCCGETLLQLCCVSDHVCSVREPARRVSTQAPLGAWEPEAEASRPPARSLLLTGRGPAGGPAVARPRAAVRLALGLLPRRQGGCAAQTALDVAHDVDTWGTVGRGAQSTQSSDSARQCSWLSHCALHHSWQEVGSGSTSWRAGRGRGPPPRGSRASSRPRAHC